MQQLVAAFGRNVTFYNGHFSAQDGKHLMLILETPVAITDGARSKELLAHIQGCLKDCPSFVKVDIVAGHTHTVANESLIKGDIARTGTVATIAFLIVLIWFFRDIRAVAFFLIPAASVLIALVCSGIVFGKVSAFVVALSTVIIGIADDYGIHIYTAIRTAGRRDVVVHIARPIVLAALFTSGIFFVFFFSSIPGYHQLAFLTIVSIWLCVWFVLLIFPQLVTLAPLDLPNLGEGVKSRKQDMGKVGFWCALLLILCVGAYRMHFSSEISTLDGVDANVRVGEERFEEIWLGGHKQGIFVVEAPTMDEALTINRSAFRDSATISKEIASIAPFLLPEKEQRANILAWHAFWRAKKGQDLRDGIQKSAARYGFSTDAFIPFLDLTRRDSFPGFTDVSFLKQMSERFISYSKDSVRILTFFPEESVFIDHFDRLTHKYPGTFVFREQSFLVGLAQVLIRKRRGSQGMRYCCCAWWLHFFAQSSFYSNCFICGGVVCSGSSRIIWFWVYPNRAGFSRAYDRGWAFDRLWRVYAVLFATQY